MAQPAEAPHLVVDSGTSASVLDLRVFDDATPPEALVFDGNFGFIRQWTLGPAARPVRLGVQSGLSPVCVRRPTADQAICHEQDAVAVYDLNGGQELHRAHISSSPSWPFDCTADARCAWMRTETDRSSLVSGMVTGGGVNKQVELQKLQATDIKFDPSGSTLAIALTDRSVRLFDAQLHLKCSAILTGADEASEFGSMVAGMQEYASLKRPGFSFLMLKGSATALAFDPSGHYLAVGATTGVHVLETERCAESETLDLGGAAVTSILFAKSALVASTVEGSVRSWDLKHPDGPIREVKLDGDVAVRLAAGRGDSTVLALTDVGRAHVVDLDGSKLLGTFAFFRDGRWLAWSPHGQFTGSEGAWQHGKWTFGDPAGATLPMEAYYRGFYDPDLIEEMLQGWERGAAIGKINREVPVVQVEMTGDQPAQDTLVPGSGIRHEPERATFHFRARAASDAAGVSSLLLAHNGMAVKRVVPGNGSISVQELDGHIELLMDPGDNTVQVYAYNKAGVRSTPVTWERKGTGWAFRVEPTTLRVLSVGITKYAVASYGLAYAADDAKLAVSALNTVQGTFPVISQRLNARPVDINGLNNIFAIPSAFEGEALVDARATRKAILDRLRALASTAKPTDIVIIFLAGHGTDRQPDAGYFFLPYDAPARERPDGTPLSAETIANGLLSEDDITLALEPLRARYSALVLDTCSSGAILEGQQLGPLEEHSRRFMRLAYEKGMHVVVAAQSEEVAVERRDYGHGVLAHALFDLGLLDDGADQSPRDGLIELGEWLAWGARKADTLERERGGDSRDRPVPQYVPPATAWPESAVLRATASFKAASGAEH